MNDPAHSSDEELAESLSNSDAQAASELAARYARSLYDFALRLTLDEDVAPRLVREAFEQAGNAGASAGRPSLRAFLYSFILTRGLESLEDRSGDSTGKILTSDRRFTLADANVDREAALWAWQAARGLRPRDYGVLDLTVRRGLDAEDLSGPAVQSRGGPQSVLNRANAGFAEAYVATALYFRGRDACEGLSDLVGGSGAAMRVGIRRQIVSHAEDCTNCQATLDSLPSASAVLAALYEVEPPDDLPASVVGALTAASAAQLAFGTDLSPSDSEPEDAGDEVEPSDETPETPPEETWQDEPKDDAPVTEEQLWAPHPEVEGAGLSEADVGEAVAAAEEAAGESSFEPPYRPNEVVEQYGTEYEAEQPRYAGYSPPPLTLRDRLAIWFEPAYGRSFVPSYAILGVITAVAVVFGLLVADVINGGGGDGEAALGPDTVRDIVCQTGPLTLNAGTSTTFQFDPAALNGYQLIGAAVSDEPAVAEPGSLSVNARNETTLVAAAAAVFATSRDTHEYVVQLLWSRNGEEAVSVCPMFVNVAPASGPAPTPTTESEDDPEPTATP